MVLVAACLVVAGCGSDDDATESVSTAGGVSTLEGRLTVVAASSLTDAFEAIETAFEAAHDGVDVELSFDGSAKLATALVQGAPADLFASADAASMTEVLDAGRTSGDPVTFATNVLQIVVPAGNPRRVESLGDLAGLDLTVSLCAPEVPCGRYATQAFEAAGLEVPEAGRQDNVKGVLTQVQLGEADAGIAYLTDVLAADAVEGIDLAADQQVHSAYLASALTDASNPDAAVTFLAFLTGSEARAILEGLGFGLP